MNYLRLLGIVVLFVLVGLGTVGGCSSNNKGSGEGCCVIGPDACVDDTNKAECDFLGGELDKGVMCVNIPECDVVPPQCQVPALDTDFSNLLFLFIDESNNVLIGVTSIGTDVIITLADIEIDPAIISLFAIPISPNLAAIDSALVLETLLEATGDAVRVDNGSVFQINDLIVLDIPLGNDLEGECDSVEPIVTSSTETLRNVMLDMKIRGLLEEDGSVDSSNHILNFVDELLPPEK